MTVARSQLIIDQCGGTGGTCAVESEDSFAEGGGYSEQALNSADSGNGAASSGRTRRPEAG
ncbi:MAG: hypothetical protein RIK87_07860 [Fuerstiella sp.]